MNGRVAITDFPTEIPASYARRVYKCQRVKMADDCALVMRNSDEEKAHAPSYTQVTTTDILEGMHELFLFLVML